MMKMSLISNTIKRAGGGAQDDFRVSVELVWDRSLSPVARNEVSDVMFSGPFTTSTDQDGYWQAELDPNESIVPAGSLYKVTETQRDGALENIYYISVPDIDSWVGDILADKPDWED
jgi:hypothetical protein